MDCEQFKLFGLELRLQVGTSSAIVAQAGVAVAVQQLIGLEE